MVRSTRHLAACLTAALLGGALGMHPAAAQQTKPALDHEDTYRWNAIRGRALSPDGAWLAYVVEPWDGDPTVVIASTTGTAELRLRGRSPVFTRDSRHVALRVTPVRSVIDSLELEGVKGEDLPGDSLAIVTLADAFGEDATGVFRAGPITSFRVPEEGGAWIAYLLSKAPDEGGEGEEEEQPEEEEEPEGGEELAAEEERSAEYEKRHEKDEGTPLVLRDLETMGEHVYENVVSYVVAESGAALAFATSTEDEGGDGVHVVDPESGVAMEVLAGEGHYVKLAFDEAGERFAVLTNRDEWQLDQPSFTLYRAEADDWTALPVAGTGSTGLPEGWWVSEHGSVSFSADGTRLFFGTAPRPEPEPDEEILDEDEVRLDIWNWRDDYLQPMQLVRAERERERSYLAVRHAGEDRIVQLGSLEVPDVQRTEEGSADFVLGTTDVPYRQELSWDGRYQDAWAIDVRTGERRPIVRRVRGFRGASLSPGGTRALWWDEGERDWMAAPLDGSSEPVNLTEALGVAFHDELDDHPQGPPPYGGAVWTEDDAAVLLPDRHDIWRAEPAGATAPVRLTTGREEGVRYRVMRIDPDAGGFGGGGEPAPNGEIYLSVFDLETKASGYARGRSDRRAAVRTLLAGDFRYGSATKAEDADRV
ncbi:MAG: hypothetical protein R3266_06920, partial [Gemmatimonadota bacterium]|nr:hypothetical protein [Gemmatimonadota bacterium]